jgi:uncharacterized protein YjbI with pentapeptide repeats
MLELPQSCRLCVRLTVRCFNLTGANLTEANLGDCTLTEANLTGANLTRANLYRTYLYSDSRSWSRITEADLPNATLCSTIMGDGHKGFRDCPK